MTTQRSHSGFLCRKSKFPAKRKGHSKKDESLTVLLHFLVALAISILVLFGECIIWCDPAVWASGCQDAFSKRQWSGGVVPTTLQSIEPPSESSIIITVVVFVRPLAVRSSSGGWAMSAFVDPHFVKALRTPADQRTLQVSPARYKYLLYYYKYFYFFYKQKSFSTFNFAPPPCCRTYKPSIMACTASTQPPSIVIRCCAPSAKSCATNGCRPTQFSSG